MEQADQANPETNRPDRGFRSPFGSAAGRPPSLAELPEKLLALLRQSPAGDIEQHLRSLVNSTVAKLDLATREEVEIQAEMIERLRARIEALEARIDDQSK
ncbi:MAG: accessory factor UbiK family protein [Burkholderiaceae bacterium]